MSRLGVQRDVKVVIVQQYVYLNDCRDIA